MKSKRENCAWYGGGGKCKCEFLCQTLHRNPKCKEISRCKKYVNRNYYAKQHNKNAHDRPFTRDTEMLVRKWYNEGNSILQLAVLTDRTTTVIEGILNNGKC